MRRSFIHAISVVFLILCVAFETKPAYAQDLPPDLDIYVVAGKTVVDDGEVLSIFISVINNTDVEIELLGVSDINGENLLLNIIALNPGERISLEDVVELRGTGTRTFTYFVDFKAQNSSREFTQLESTSVEVNPNALAEITKSIFPIVVGILIGEGVRFFADYRDKISRKGEEFRIALQNSQLYCALVMQAIDAHSMVPVDFWEKTMVEDDAIQLLDNEAKKHGETNYLSNYAELILLVYQYNNLISKELENSANFQNVVDKCKTVIGHIESVNNILKARLSSGRIQKTGGI